MNVLFATQSNGLVLFEALGRELAARGVAGRLGFTLADAWFYEGWRKRNPDFEGAGHVLLKEWEVTARRSGKPDFDRLAGWEHDLGGPGLFGALVADRRLLMGPDCTYSQDYRRRFSDDELLCILGEAAAAVERLFDELKPGLVVGFICVSILEYLVYLFARARGVRYLNLRTARIGNRVILASTLNDPAPEQVAAFRRCRELGSPFIAEAEAHIARVRGAHAKYEGVVAPSAKPVQRVALRRNPLAGALRLLRTQRAFRASVAAGDNHCPGILRPLAFKALVNPWRARRVERSLRPRYVTPGELAGRRYAFLPLHTEPEVSLLVYQRPLINQIEAVRAFALSLPADMLLVVKEHPWMVGKRSLAAYGKLLNIPRVRLAPPDSEARAWVAGAALVTVLTSSVGLEAAMLKKPVVSLGHAPFNMLPPGMVRRCTDLLALPQVIAAALAEAAHDEAALTAYVAAVMEGSAPVNLYTNLLGRAGAHADEARGFAEDVAALAGHLLERLERPDPAPQADTAPW